MEKIDKRSLSYKEFLPSKRTYFVDGKEEEKKNAKYPWDDKSRFRNHLRQFYTRGLFLESFNHPQPAGCIPMYTLSDEDIEDDGVYYYSIRRLYLNKGDMTEYSFGETYFYNYKHFEHLMKSQYFSDIIISARKELDLKLTGELLKKIQEKASLGDLNAQKFLVSRSWEPQEAKRGRPSTRQIKTEAKKLLKEMTPFDEDYERILGSEASGSIQ